ncbi:MAG TPA: hypothetical protein VNN07_15430 [Candidatus Tectomicrobia bacterium]|nr:hypothetical protein [Candidatus Tectomicrobia bacterium]
MRTAIALAVAALAALAPALAEACPTCLSTPYGDRTYTWPQLGLLLMPFVVGAVVGGIVAWCSGWRPRAALRRLTALRFPPAPAGAGAPDARMTKETT